VVVAWEDLRDPLINIRANISLNSGATWQADGERVDKDVVDGDSLHPRLAVRPGGRVFIVWEDTNRGKKDIYVNYSENGATTWGPVARRVDADDPGFATSARPYIAVAPSGNNVYVAWEDYRNGMYRDIYFSISLDDGVTWNIPDYRINESTPAGAADARSPFLWATSSPNRVAVMWMDNRSGPLNGPHTTGSNADIYGSYVE